jgi:hypothetical protein
LNAYIMLHLPTWQGFSFWAWCSPSTKASLSAHTCCNHLSFRDMIYKYSYYGYQPSPVTGTHLLPCTAASCEPRWCSIGSCVLLSIQMSQEFQLDVIYIFQSRSQRSLRGEVMSTLATSMQAFAAVHFPTMCKLSCFGVVSACVRVDGPLVQRYLGLLLLLLLAGDSNGGGS